LSTIKEKGVTKQLTGVLWTHNIRRRLARIRWSGTWPRRFRTASPYL